MLSEADCKEDWKELGYEVSAQHIFDTLKVTLRQKPLNNINLSRRCGSMNFRIRYDTSIYDIWWSKTIEDVAKIVGVFAKVKRNEQVWYFQV